jgi:hypothetical protein
VQGHIRLSNFSSVPDALSSVMGSLSFGDGSDSPEQIMFREQVESLLPFPI